MRWVLRAARFSALLALSVGACTLGMRDKDELSGGGSDAGVEGGSDAGPCADGYADCDGIGANGCETFVLKDPKHCGGCGKACFTGGNTAVCNQGACGASSCTSPSLDCDSDPATCETNSETSTDHCGFCGNACALPNAVQQCVGGSCTFETCNPGYDDCDGLAATGCEASLKSATDCGSCGASCSPSNATGACDTGTCAVGSCNTGYADCDKSVTNGCEANLQTDPSNCGACGTACAAGQACKNGQCEVTACQSPMADCDNNPDCETNVQTSLQHCGFCNNACNLPNATPACKAGQCAVDSCSTGYGDCDETAPGCETTLGTTSNCTACGDSCGGVNVASAACEASGCKNTCTTGFGDCTAVKGCETNILTSESNCGACGNNCAASAPPHTVGVCKSGSCNFEQCAPGWGDCSGAAGCETNLTTATNCGACGRSCAGCTNGVCPPDTVSGLSAASTLDESNNGTAIIVGRSPGGIHSVNKSSLAVSPVYPTANAISLDVYTGDVIYWGDPNTGVLRGTVSGSATQTLSTQTGVYAVDATSGGHVFFSAAGGMFRVAQTGGATSTVDPTPGPHGIRGDAASLVLYWAMPALGQVRTKPFSGGVVANLAPAESQPESVLADATHVYWTNSGDGRIRRAPVGGGPATDVATGQTGAFGIHLEGSDVYWTTNLASGGVYKAPKTGGFVTKLAENCAFPRTLIVDNTHVWWVESGSGTLKRVQR